MQNISGLGRPQISTTSIDLARAGNRRSGNDAEDGKPQRWMTSVTIRSGEVSWGRSTLAKRQATAVPDLQLRCCSSFHCHVPALIFFSFMGRDRNMDLTNLVDPEMGYDFVLAVTAKRSHPTFGSSYQPESFKILSGSPNGDGRQRLGTNAPRPDSHLPIQDPSFGNAASSSAGCAQLGPPLQAQQTSSPLTNESPPAPDAGQHLNLTDPLDLIPSNLNLERFPWSDLYAPAEMERGCSSVTSGPPGSQPPSSLLDLAGDGPTCIDRSPTLTATWTGCPGAGGCLPAFRSLASKLPSPPHGHWQATSSSHQDHLMCCPTLVQRGPET